MKTIVIIPSRMSSKRFPGKPMAKINGIPMIQMVWEKAKAANVGEVYVACSENEIYDLIKSIGGKAILTDPKLATGTDRIFQAFQSLDKIDEIDSIINLQGDMPLINPTDIINVIKPLKNNYSISTLATNLLTNQISNPNITKIEVEWMKNNIGLAKNFFRIKKEINANTFHHVGIYGYTPDSLKNFINTSKSENEIKLNLEQFRVMDAGINIGVVYVPNILFGIDTKEDLIDAESIIRQENAVN
tara:strand:+ start:1913 stop:2647 length:735 start_codon:yes stop_codon:yes gene_type:complete